MSTLTYPTLSTNPQRATFAYDGNSAIHTSWQTGFVMATSFGGERWEASVFYDNLENDDRTALIAFIARLNGQENRVALPVFGATNRGNFGGTPLVDGADQTGKSVNLKNASTGITDWIKEGDYFSFNGELKMATADADSDGSGNVTVSFAPRIRTSPADDAAVETSDPTGTFILIGPRVEWSYRPGSFSDFSLSFVEALS